MAQPKTTREDGSEGETSAKDIPRNHGAWIKELWSWKDANYPDLNASFEVIGIQYLSENSSLLIKKLSNWIDINTPTNPFVAASFYITLPSGSSSQNYATVTENILQAYHSVSSKPLWIDEFGQSFGTKWTVQDQRNAYQGFLEASVCGYPNRYPKFAWVAGNDYPYDGQNWFGLVSGFSEGIPIMRETWDDLSFYYNLEACQTSVEIHEPKSDLPGTIYIRQNYPNPFNSTTTIKYNLPTSNHIMLKIYNLIGQEIRTLVNRSQAAGEYQVKWRAEELPSGIYFYRLEVTSPEINNEVILIKRMILLK